jgi:hypothetical protein
MKLGFFNLSITTDFLPLNIKTDILTLITLNNMTLIDRLIFYDIFNLSFFLFCLNNRTEIQSIFMCVF